MRHATDRSNVAEQATIRRRDLHHTLLNAESCRVHRLLRPGTRTRQDSVNVVKQGDRPSGPPPAITVVQRRSR